MSAVDSRPSFTLHSGDQQHAGPAPRQTAVGGLVAAVVAASIQNMAGTGSTTKILRRLRQVVTWLALPLLMIVTVSFGLSITLLEAETFIPMTIASTTDRLGVTTSYTAAGNGTASYSAFQYVEVQTFTRTNTSNGTDGSNSTASSVDVYLQDNFGFSCHYSVYSHAQSLASVWSPDLDGSWAYRLTADSGQQTQLPMPTCGVLTCYSAALIILCVCIAWEFIGSTCLRLALAQSEEIQLQRKSARVLTTLFTLAVIFNALAIACCLTAVLTLWQWIHAASLPQQTVEAMGTVITVLCCVIAAIYTIDLPLNYYALRGMLTTAEIATSPIRFHSLLCCYKESVPQNVMGDSML